jgi:hypothetical protein
MTDGLLFLVEACGASFFFRDVCLVRFAAADTLIFAPCMRPCLLLSRYVVSSLPHSLYLSLSLSLNYSLNHRSAFLLVVQKACGGLVAAVRHWLVLLAEDAANDADTFAASGAAATAELATLASSSSSGSSSGSGLSATDAKRAKELARAQKNKSAAAAEVNAHVGFSAV